MFVFFLKKNSIQFNSFLILIFEKWIVQLLNYFVVVENWIQLKFQLCFFFKRKIFDLLLTFSFSLSSNRKVWSSLWSFWTWCWCAWCAIWRDFSLVLLRADWFNCQRIDFHSRLFLVRSFSASWSNLWQNIDSISTTFG